MQLAEQPVAQPTTRTDEDRILCVARDIGRSIAAGIISRIHSFPLRERFLRTMRRMRFESSLPEGILWEGLGDEAAPIFVVYKLIHEAFSSSPFVFRKSLEAFMRAQPERFPVCFSRETLWAAMAAYPDLDAPRGTALATLHRAIAQAVRPGVWWRPDQEIDREALILLLQMKQDTFRSGFRALKVLQSESPRGLTCGKLLLAVPGRLASYAQEIVGLARGGHLPSLEEMHARVDEFARDKEIDARHESIPLDLLYTTKEDNLLHVCIFARTKANRATMENLRRHSLFIRYFLRKAFAGYKPHNLSVKLAFYLDYEAPEKFTDRQDRLFHASETTGMGAFWGGLCPAVDPKDLIGEIRRSAISVLQAERIVPLIRAHLNAPRPIVSAAPKQNRASTTP